MAAIECTNLAHELMKRDEYLWRQMAKCGSGIQPGFGGPDLELRQCPCCQSTLAREIVAGEEAAHVA